MGEGKHEYSREELYELVWSQPMVKLAARFDISNVGLKKICRKNDIPVPGVGYWRRVETGKRTKKTPLPKQSSTDTIVLQQPTATQIAKRQLAEQQTKAQLEQEDLKENRIIVSKRLTKPHPRTIATAGQLDRYGDNYGMAVAGGTELFRVRASGPNIRRALRILDTLFKAFDKRGWKVRSATYDRGNASVVIDGEEVQFAIDETAHRTPHQLTAEEKRDKERYGHTWAPRYDYHPSGRLTLKITSHYWGEGLRVTWNDREGQPIEEKLNEFMASMKLVASYRRQETIRRAEERRRREEYEAQQREIQRRKDAEAKAVQKLFHDASLWKQVQDVQQYIAAIKSEASARGEETTTETELGRWLAWAETQAENNDPLISAFRNSDWSLPE